MTLEDAGSTWALSACFISADWLGPRMDEIAARDLNASEKELDLCRLVGRRRLEFLLGRVAAKRALVALNEGGRANDWNIRYGVFRQPVVDGPGPARAVSISHSGERAVAVAFDQGLLCGVDLETLRDGSQAAIESQMSEADLELLAQLDLPYGHALTLGWSVKESVSKALRIGLLAPFKSFGLSHISTLGKYCWRVELGTAQALCAYVWRRGDAFLSLAIPRKIVLSGQLTGHQ